MENEYTSPVEVPKEKPKVNNHGVTSGLYGLAFIGSAAYYMIHAASFWMGIVGFLKAIVWPVFLVYDLMEFLKM